MLKFESGENRFRHQAPAPIKRDGIFIAHTAATCSCACSSLGGAPVETRIAGKMAETEGFEPSIGLYNPITV
jgi:hypothetical protein